MIAISSATDQSLDGSLYSDKPMVRVMMIKKAEEENNEVIRNGFLGSKKGDAPSESRERRTDLTVWKML